MSTASATAPSLSAAETFSHWLQKSLASVQSAVTGPRTKVTRPFHANRQEADKLRALARDMMRIDAGSAADMYAAADRHEFGYNR